MKYRMIFEAVLFMAIVFFLVGIGSELTRLNLNVERVIEKMDSVGRADSDRVIYNVTYNGEK